jgi:hypothetical protein
MVNPIEELVPNRAASADSVDEHPFYDTLYVYCSKRVVGAYERGIELREKDVREKREGERERERKTKS